MKRLLVSSLLVLFAATPDLYADRSHYRAHHRIGIRSYAQPPSQDRRSRIKRPVRRPSQDMHSRIKRPARLPVHPRLPAKPGHPIYPGYKPGKPGHDHLGDWWPASTTVVRETQPIIIVNHPPPQAPQKTEDVWVPSVVDTRTEPGYWDYGIKKAWMGDHWRYEQDYEEKKWVPASQVKYVKQEGYWKTAKSP